MSLVDFENTSTFEILNKASLKELVYNNNCLYTAAKKTQIMCLKYPYLFSRKQKYSIMTVITYLVGMCKCNTKAL